MYNNALFFRCSPAHLFAVTMQIKTMIMPNPYPYHRNNSQSVFRHCSRVLYDQNGCERTNSKLQRLFEDKPKVN